MFGGGPRRMMQQETSNRRMWAKTLGRLASYFKPYWPVLILVLVLILVNTYSQVITPELTGQAVDCYLTPATKPPGNQAAQIAGLPATAGAAQTSTNCWFDTLPANATTS